MPASPPASRKEATVGRGEGSFAAAAPITMIPAPASLIPLAYHVHVKVYRCANCASVHEFPEVYAFNTLKSRLGMGKEVNSLVPVDRFTYRLPIRVTRMEPKSVPVCQECVDQIAAADAFRGLPDGLSAREWELTLQRKAAAEERAANLQAQAAKRPPTKSGGQPALSETDLLNLL